MATRVTTTHLDDGTLAVTKTALTGDRVDRMAEAKWLAEVRSPIVVRLLRVDGGSESTDPNSPALVSIQTEHAGQRTLRTARESPEQVARLLVRLARGLAAIHDQGLVHGKINLDHIILGPDATVLLCSPTGIATDPSDDFAAIGTVITELLGRWDSDGITVANRSEWEQIVERLSAADDSTSAHRIGRWLAPLAVERSPSHAARVSGGTPENTDSRRLGPTGLIFVASFVGLALLGRLVGPFGSNPASSAAETGEANGEVLQIADGWFQFDQPGVAASSTPACSEGSAAYLDGSSTVWTIDDVADGAEATPTAIVPGATELAFELSDDGLCELWATGPAGRSQIDW